MSSASVTSLLGPVPRRIQSGPQIRYLSLEGAHKKRLDQGRSRLVLTFAAFVAVYALIGVRLIHLAFFPEAERAAKIQNDLPAAARPDIVDRNGQILATDIKQPSLFAEPRKVIDPDEAAEQLSEIIPEMNAADLREKLSSGKGFVWLKREITPRQQEKIYALGLPGIGFNDENRRVYPAASMVSHVLGHVNVDNQGIAGLEKWIDQERGLAALHAAGFATDSAQKPVQLSLDLRVQHAMHDELADAMERYKAIAAAGVVMNVHTGEVVGLTSLPDYNPNDAREALLPDRINRITTGTYEMGSTFKAFTLAMALESGRFKLEDKFDARTPLVMGGHTIDDMHGQRRMLTMTEVFVYSSNVASARMALALGTDYQRDFLRKLGMFSRLRTELPESAEPQLPKHWAPINTATIAFGHGMAVSPLQAVTGAAALLNGGYLVQPTFQKRTLEEARALAVQVIQPRTSDIMRGLFRANVERGTAKRADVEGYFVGGKTGTAEKVIDGKYAKDRRMTDFIATFPTDNPQYVLLVMLDEPQKVAETGGAATASVNAAPTAGKIIARVAPLLSVSPRIERLAGAEPAALTR